MPKKSNSQEINETIDPVETTSLVAPIESVESKEEITDPCWNCGDQLVDNKCSKCGFDKSLIHNLDLEAKRTKEILEAQKLK